MIDHDEQLRLEPPPPPVRRSRRVTASDVRACRELLRKNRGRVLTVEQVREGMEARR